MQGFRILLSDNTQLLGCNGIELITSTDGLWEFKLSYFINGEITDVKTEIADT